MISSMFFWTIFSLGLKEMFMYSKIFILDPYTLFMLTIFPLIYYVISSGIFVSSSNEEKFKFNTIFFFFFFFLALCFMSDATIMFLFFLEMCACIMIFFIFNFSKDLDKISSCIFMFFSNVVGSIPFMFFSSYFWNKSLFTSTGVCCFSSYIFFSFLLLLASKLPMFLLHFWLTKAHVSASGAGSMILASLMLKIGTVGLIKWGFIFSFMLMSVFSSVLILLMLSSIFILMLMNRFFDFKYLVACSSIIHMCFILPFSIASSPMMVYSSVLMMVGHGVASCMVFFLATIIYEKNQDRSILSNKSLESGSYLLSMLMIFWLIMNLGFPPLVSFISEVYFFVSLMQISMLLSLTFLLILLLSGMYFIHVSINFLFQKKNLAFKETNFTMPMLISLLSGLSFFSICFFFS